MKKIDLGGQWKLHLDKDKKKEKDILSFAVEMDDKILLPGTTAEQKKGENVLSDEVGFLTEEYHFEGYAWFEKEIELTESDATKMVFLYMERTRKSYVWVNGHDLGLQDSFVEAHVYDCSPYVKAGKNIIRIMVSNIDYKTKGGHLTSPDTQTNWNGILGEFALHIYEGIQIEDVQVYPEKKTGILAVSARIKSAEHTDSGTVIITCRSCKTNEKLVQKKEAISLCRGSNSIHIVMEADPEKIRGWSEYSPELYNVEIIVQAGNMSDNHSLKIGFRDLKIEGHTFYLNEIPIMLRGKQEAMVFPLTAYAPMDKESWKKVLGTAKEYGINHYRCHTCCPPEAAFEAADEVGLYFEPEIPFWGTIHAPEEEEYNKEEQDFLKEEGFRMLRAFGNHPSFLALSLGNELWGSKEELNSILGSYKEIDQRHWYTQGSNNFQFTPCILENDDFFCGVRFSTDRLIRGSYGMCDAPQGHVQVTEPENIYSYDEAIVPGKTEEGGIQGKDIQIQYGTGVKTVHSESRGELISQIPIVSHEIGQYEFYPDFDEIPKYTGVMKPRNIEIFRKRLQEKGMLHMAGRFFHSVGKLAVDCYKRELETAFRSRELAGYQLLDLQDFPGQGTALVGILNSFMENKGLITAQEWRRFCSDQVIQVAFERYVYQAGDHFAYEILFTNMNPIPMEDTQVVLRLMDESGQEVDSVVQEVSAEKLALSRLTTLGAGSLTLPTVEYPKILFLSVSIEGTAIRNQYELYLYPTCEKVKPVKDDRLVVTNQKKEMQEALEKGKKVLFFGNPRGEDKTMEGTYCTDFWCYPMFASISESMGRKLPIGTMGLCIDDSHPAFHLFPTREYTTPQWWKLVYGTDLAILDDTEIEPIVWMVDNFARNHKLGFLYEMKVDQGVLVVCQADLLSEGHDSLPEKWLYNSLISYMVAE